MNEQGERLRKARELSGFATAKEAATSIGVPVSTYIQHENGQRGLPVSKATLYARSFKVTEEWLLFGYGPVEQDQKVRLERLFNRIREERREQALAILKVLGDDVDETTRGDA